MRVKGAGFIFLALWSVLALAATSPELDGLVEVKPKRMDAAWLLPGVDFRQYSAVMIDEPDVAFDKDWMRNMNETRSLSRRVSQADAEKIAAATRSGLVDVFQEEFRKAGYSIATAPGADVLRLSPAIVRLYINAPDVMSAGPVAYLHRRCRRGHAGAEGRGLGQWRAAGHGSRPPRGARHGLCHLDQQRDQPQRFPAPFPAVGENLRQGTR